MMPTTNRVVEFKAIEYTELRPGNKGDLVLGVEVGIKEDPSFNRPNPPSVHLDGPTSVRDAVVRLKKDRAVEPALLGDVPMKGDGNAVQPGRSQDRDKRVGAWCCILLDCSHIDEPPCPSRVGWQVDIPPS